MLKAGLHVGTIGRLMAVAQGCNKKDAGVINYKAIKLRRSHGADSSTDDGYSRPTRDRGCIGAQLRIHQPAIRGFTITKTVCADNVAYCRSDHPECTVDS